MALRFGRVKGVTSLPPKVCGHAAIPFIYFVLVVMLFTFLVFLYHHAISSCLSLIMGYSGA
ncbi:uncharacterized protein G2W53_001076 [Senna tora]|uniref:Uncharacterized protein n=1 Tax=Senna tora TaxID=362788 RepID=A0A835CK09_9FABA|nr:uncharacterized protein G2W53_001076 [Senna tora]